MSKIPEFMGGRSLEHSAAINGAITTKRGVTNHPAAKVGGQIYNVQNVALVAIVETTLGTVSLPASSLSAGTVLRLRAIGRNSNNAGANNLTLTLKVGSTSVATLTANPGANDYIILQADVYVSTTGGSGIIQYNGRTKVGAGAETVTLNGATIDTAAAQAVALTGSWDVAESFVLGSFSVEVVG